MHSISLWMRAKVTKFGTMPGTWQLYALLNLALDMLLLGIFMVFLHVGITRDVNTFIFWIPALALLCWFRLRQAGRRWSL